METPSMVMGRDIENAVGLIPQRHLSLTWSRMFRELEGLRLILSANPVSANPVSEPCERLGELRWLGSERFLFNYIQRLAENAPNGFTIPPTSTTGEFFNRSCFNGTESAPNWMIQRPVFLRYLAQIARWDDISRMKIRCQESGESLLSRHHRLFGDTPFTYRTIKMILYSFDLDAEGTFFDDNTYRHVLPEAIFRCSWGGESPKYWMWAQSPAKQRPYQEPELEATLVARRWQHEHRTLARDVLA